jgi:hypothetical protein
MGNWRDTMPHLDEGTIHEYLDGEIGPDERRREVELHLNECGDCNAALEDARRIRDTATGILSCAVPDDVPMPSFEELQAKAIAGGYVPDGEIGGDQAKLQRSLIRMRSLAWAATVILAAAVGWYARSAVLSSGPAPYASEDESVGRMTLEVPQTPADVAVADSEAPPTLRTRGAPAEVATAATETLGPEAAVMQERPALDAGGASVEEEPAEPAPEQIAGMPERPKGAAEATADSAARLTSVAGRFESPEARSVSVPSEAPAPTMARVAAGAGAVAAEGWTEVDMAGASAILQGPVPTIGGLAVVGYAASSLEGQQAVRVRQLLESGSPIELIVVADNVVDVSGAERKRVRMIDVAAEANADGINSIIVLHESMRIRISAAVTTDSLRVLSEKISAR